MSAQETTRASIQCPECGRSVPDGFFCGACGAHLAHLEQGRTHRQHAWAADPDQHVLHPSVVTTLFPHLPHRRRLPFQIALGVAAALLVVLGLLRLTGPSIALAALAMPLLYLLYLYEVEVYADEPVLVIGLTFAVGLVLGAVWSQVTGRLETRLLLENTTFGVSLNRVLLGGVALPLAAQVLMLAGALALYVRGRALGYDEALDGFSFGAASALGFTLAATIVNLLPVLRLGLVSNVQVEANLLDIVQRGLFVPFINASLTGLIAGALWLRRGPIRRLRFHSVLAGLPAVLLGVLALRIFLGIISVVAIDALTSAAAYGLVALLTLAWARLVLHQMLLTEAVEVTVGPESVCSHCHHLVPRMAFCPHCGIATRATPKTGSGRALRAVR
ncbi:MAG TPA: hypothetical protein VFE42_28510 [Chloroflexota bacterium]|nr:hypothetical protein [Chloroflexota bacterium]